MSEPVALESAKNGAVDAYIAARPQLDSIHNRRIFESGFEHGWKARRTELEGKDAAIAELVGVLSKLQDAYRQAVGLHDPSTDTALTVLSHNAIAKHDIPKDGL